MIETDAIYRVFMAGDATERFAGTAFAIAPNAFLTCAHLFHNVPRPPRAVLRGPAKYGDIGRLRWHFHETIDCACAILEPGAGGPDEVMPVQLRDVTSDLSELDCLGYFDATSSIQRWTDKVSGNSFTDGWIALANTISDGVSGGPVVYNGRAVALVRADNLHRNQKYVLPLISVWQWIERLGIVLPTGAGANNLGLARVPIGPPVHAGDIPDAVIRAFAAHLPIQQDAARFVQRAMRERGQTNPEGFRDDQILLEPVDLNMGGIVASTDYWGRVIYIAAGKSRRTLAALFLAAGAPDSRLMSPAEGIEYRKFLDWLIRPDT